MYKFSFFSLIKIVNVMGDSQFILSYNTLNPHPQYPYISKIVMLSLFKKTPV